MGRLILSILVLFLLGLAGLAAYFAVTRPEPVPRPVDLPVAPQPGAQ